MSRVLLAFLLFTFAGGCSSVTQPATPEDKAVALVLKLGGEISRDPEAAGHPVIGVHLRESKVTDADMKELAPLTHLISLNLSKTQISDVGLKEVVHFQKLEALSVRETLVTDASIKGIAALPRLKDLYIGGSQITDAGLKELRQLAPKCEFAK